MIEFVCEGIATIDFFKPFHASGLFLYPLKNIRNLEVENYPLKTFRGYRKRSFAENGLIVRRKVSVYPTGN